MIQLIDLNYHTHSDISKPEDVLELQKASVGFVNCIKEKLAIQLIKHADYEGEKWVDGVKYSFFKSRNTFWHIPFKTHRYLKTQQPDIVLIQGFIFPIQLLALKFKLGKKTKIMVQHHGEKPFRGVKKLFQKIADRWIEIYLFTSMENANEWIENKIISHPKKCHELLEASTYFKQKNKLECKSILNLTGSLDFLWVGRLHIGKDPMTILNAFEKYSIQYPEAKLFMIYQTEELLPEIKRKLDQNQSLKNSVILKGSVHHAELETWFGAADFFISGSHKEGSGYALIEAMACGCIPVVTSIPSFRKITGDGRFGFLFEPGNEKNLLDILLNIESINKNKLPAAIVEHFNNSLSFKSIADTLSRICKDLVSE